MKLSKIVTAVFSHSDIIDLLADAVSKETDQMVLSSAVTLEVIEGRYVTATVQLTQGASVEELAVSTTPPDSVEEQAPSEAPVADETEQVETSVEEEAEAALSGPAPEGASDSGVKDPESSPEPEETVEETAEEEAPKPVKKASGLNFKKTKPPAKPDNEVKPESLFKFTKKK